jgi:hypothetical protein
MVYLTDLADVARTSGLIVVEVDGWRTCGRPGDFDPNGTLCHHTGSYDDIGDTSSDRAYADWLAKTGRPDLPAPLCQLGLSAESVVYVCAAGRANHAGTARPSGPMPGGDGNEMYIGIEAYNDGSQGWGSLGVDAAGEPVTQADGYARLCAALARGYGWPASHTRAHRETSETGKWDPGRLDMDQHRARTAHYIDVQEDDMPFTENQLRQIVREEVGAVLDEPLNIKQPGDKRFTGVSFREVVKRIAIATGAVKKTS